jgi:hypothetical protein
VLGLAAAALAGCGAGQSPRGTPPDRATEFIVTFWCAPPSSQFDDARAAEIAAAGFTTVGAPCEGGLERAANLAVLDVAARHGLRVWVGDHHISPLTVGQPGWSELLAAAIAAYRSHPALAGYVVADEPTADEFAAVAAVVAALRAADPAHLAYVNLLPNYIPAKNLGAESYEAYLDSFVTTVRPELLSVDYYPFGKEKDRSTFFANLTALRDTALRHQVPFLLIVLAMPHGPYRDPSEAELAWQVHHALAFGARGISYFAYWTPKNDDDDDWNNRYGLIENGRPTLHYFQIARLNQSLRALGAALASYRSIAVADSIGEIGVGFPIGPIDAIDGGPITAGLFGDPAGRLAVLLVNRDYRYGVTAGLRLHPGAPLPEVFDPSQRRWQAAGGTSFILAPGDARLLRWIGSHGQ